MDKIILGLLVLRTMTIYEIKQYISKYLSFSYTDSMGSIQYALKKLLSLEEVYYEAFVENGHNKKVYAITDKGLHSFKKWLEQPVDHRKSRSLEESKIFFIGLAEQGVRVRVLQSYITGLKKKKEQLLDIKRMVEEASSDPIESNIKHFEADVDAMQRIESFDKDRNLHDAIVNIYDYQMSTLRYSLMETEFHISFYQDLLNTESKKLDR